MEKITLCGDDCMQCPRYLAKSEEELDRVAALWYKIGMSDRVLSHEEIRCMGCTSRKTCTYHLKDCTMKHHVEKCNQCSAFPCEKIETMLNRSKAYQKTCLERCTEKEYEAISGAFFHTMENLQN